MLRQGIMLSAYLSVTQEILSVNVRISEECLRHGRREIEVNRKKRAGRQFIFLTVGFMNAL
jgi:hypothetical protein